MSIINNIRLTKISESRYNLEFYNGVNLGDFTRDVDGYFYWFPGDSKGGCYSDYILRELGEKLIELNKEWDLKIKEEFSK